VLLPPGLLFETVFVRLGYPVQRLRYTSPHKVREGDYLNS